MKHPTQNSKTRQFAIRLPLDVAGKVLALAATGASTTKVITKLIELGITHLPLDMLEAMKKELAALPPVKGRRSLELDEDVPIPDYTSRALYPFSSMKVGHSVWAPATEGRLLYDAAKQYAKRHSGWFCTGRSEDGGIRVWRVAE